MFPIWVITIDDHVQGALFTSDQGVFQSTIVLLSSLASNIFGLHCFTRVNKNLLTPVRYCVLILQVHLSSKSYIENMHYVIMTMKQVKGFQTICLMFYVELVQFAYKVSHYIFHYNIINGVNYAHDTAWLIDGCCNDSQLGACIKSTKISPYHGVSPIKTVSLSQMAFL